MINLSIFLYGKPSWDLNIEGEEEINTKELREHGEYLRKHLNLVADIVEKLRSHGWDCCGTLYSLEFYKEGISKKIAEEELKKLKINPKLVNIEEYDEDL